MNDQQFSQIMSRLDNINTKLDRVYDEVWLDDNSISIRLKDLEHKTSDLQKNWSYLNQLRMLLWGAIITSVVTLVINQISFSTERASTVGHIDQSSQKRLAASVPKSDRISSL